MSQTTVPARSSIIAPDVESLKARIGNYRARLASFNQTNSEALPHSSADSRTLGFWAELLTAEKGNLLRSVLSLINLAASAGLDAERKELERLRVQVEGT